MPAAKKLQCRFVKILRKTYEKPHTHIISVSRAIDFSWLFSVPFFAYVLAGAQGLAGFVFTLNIIGITFLAIGTGMLWAIYSQNKKIKQHPDFEAADHKNVRYGSAIALNTKEKKLF